MQRELPLVIRKGGETFVPTFPVELEAGDQLIIVKKMRGSQVPEGRRWTCNGYSRSGLAIVISDA